MIKPSGGHAGLLAMIRGALNGGPNPFVPDASDNDEADAQIERFVRESAAEKRIWETGSAAASNDSEDGARPSASRTSTTPREARGNMSRSGNDANDSRALIVGEMIMSRNPDAETAAHMQDFERMHQAAKRYYEEAGSLENAGKDDMRSPAAKRTKLGTDQRKKQPRSSESLAPLRRPETEATVRSYKWDMVGDARKKWLSHWGYIQETEAGIPAPQPCNHCSNGLLPVNPQDQEIFKDSCRVYNPETAGNILGNKATHGESAAIAGSADTTAALFERRGGRRGNCHEERRGRTQHGLADPKRRRQLNTGTAISRSRISSAGLYWYAWRKT